MSADDVSEDEKDEVRAFLYFGEHHYKPFPSTEGGMELKGINNFAKLGELKVRQILNSLMKQGEVKSHMDSGHTYYKLTIKGSELVDKWDNEKKAEYKKILRDKNFDPIKKT
jgi:predicted transcriptional regulator